MSGKRGLGLQDEVIRVAVAANHALHHLDPVVDSFERLSMLRPARPRRNASPLEFQY